MQKSAEVKKNIIKKLIMMSTLIKNLQRNIMHEVNNMAQAPSKPKGPASPAPKPPVKK